MKTIFTLLTSLILSIAASAADKRPGSILTIKSFDRSDIRVIIDGHRFEPNDNYMRIRGIESGYHRVKIYKEKNNGFFNIFGNQYEVVFNNSVMIRPYTNLMINVDRYGRTTVNESRMNEGGGYGRGDRRDGNRDDRGYSNRDDRGYGNRDDRGYGNRNDRSFGDRQDKGFGGRDNNDYNDQDDKNWDKGHDFDFDGGGNYGDYDKKDSRDDRGFGGGRTDRDYNSNGYKSAMNDFDFNRVLSSIEKEWFENNKSKSASQIINTNYFTTSQVKQILQLFTFESNRLDLAKQAYIKTIDQKNYFAINDVFSFSSSKEELARYIRDFR